MASSSLYNRWRPRTFAEPDDYPLVGQEHVTRTLRNAVASGAIAHAYLFCGPRGTGKTSAARILARAVNCRRGLRGEPCNACENCQALLSGRQLDLLIEIDGASNRGVDDVRQLRERLLQRPGGADLTGRYKVYIVDEVHMLTTEAFNALLKSLEEPPPHVIFVLATTDPQKVPATVASRCQRFDFKPIPLELLVRHLGQVAAAEGARLEPAAVELLARAAAGGMRDAVSLLDQALAFAGAAADRPAATAGRSAAGSAAGTDDAAYVTAAHVRAMLGLTDFEAVSHLVDRLVEHDLGGALRLVHEVVGQGADLRQYARQVLEYLRALLLTASAAGALLHLDEDTRDAIEQRAQRLPLPELVRLIKLIAQAEQGLKAPAAQPQLPLELALAEAVVGRPAAADRGADTWSEPAVAVPTDVRRARPSKEAADGRDSTRAAGDDAPGVRPERGSSPSRATVAAERVGAAERAKTVVPVALLGAAGAAPAIPVVSGAEVPALSLSKGSGAEGEPGDAVAVNPGAPASRRTATLTLERVQEHWPATLEALRRANRPVEALLKDATPIAVDDGNVVVLQFRFAFHCNKVNEPANNIAARKALSRALGVECRVRCVLAEGSGSRPSRGHAAADDPVVAKALRIWRAHILSPGELAAVEAVPLAPVAPVAPAAATPVPDND